MVSFQCDACTDVVKKPKLDRHYGQCHASFTCIDCSATFSGPPQWKGHTTCITEAEKYQKSLYKGAKKGQDPRPSNGNHRNTQVSKIPGKYHQSQNNQQSWSRRQYAPNYVSGANSTPLGSPPRMSPVDSSPVDSSENAPKTQPEVGKKRDLDVLVEADASNAAQPKPKKKKRHDDAKRPEVALPQEPPSVVNGHRKSKKSKEGSKAETEPSLAPEKDRGEKKSKKRKRKEGDGDESNAIEQTDATSNDKPDDEKKAKKRKHKEKREDDSPSKQNDVPDEVVATNGEEVKEKAKKRKKSKEKGDEVSPKTEIVEKTRKKRKKSESST
ncbi:hypothetical protein V8E53_010122 [Lactarius tabidus]